MGFCLISCIVVVVVDYDCYIVGMKLVIDCGHVSDCVRGGISFVDKVRDRNDCCRTDMVGVRCCNGCCCQSASGFVVGGVD